MKRTICTIFALASLFTTTIASQLNVATFNVWLSPDGNANSWQERKNSVAALVRFHDFDVFGTQEGYMHQLDDIKQNDGVYEYVAAGRDDGKKEGETSGIFYKKNKFELLDSGSFWFAETPNKPVKGWDAMCKRICTWVELKDKSTNQKFFFFSCHFDHVGKIARKNSAELYVETVDKIVGNAPFVGVGDFNAAPDDEPIKIILSSPKIRDAHAISKTVPYGPRNTYHGNSLEKSSQPERIDYIFVSPNVNVESIGVLTDLLCASDSADYKELSTPKNKNIRHPSDHFPVRATVKF